MAAPRSDGRLLDASMNASRMACHVERIEFPTQLPVHAFFHSVQKVDLHLHIAFEVLLVLSGRVMLYTDVGEQRLQAGDVAIVHGSEPHATHDLGEPNVVLALHVDPAVARHDAHFARRRFDLQPLLDDPGKGALARQLRCLVARVMIESRMKRSAWEMEVEALVLQLLALLLRKVPSTLVDATSRSLLDEEVRVLGPRLAGVAEYIRRQAGEPISISTVARAHGLSSGYLSRLFKSETGESFGSFITQVRLRRSLDLLSAPASRPITDIALDCGFPNVKSFNLAFKRAFGATPSAWRQARLARPAVPVSYYGGVDEATAMRLLHCYADGSGNGAHGGPEIP